MNLILELYTVTPVNQDVAAFHRCTRPLTGLDRDPDEVARELLSDSEDSPLVAVDRCLLHSTSWRYERPDSVVLSYLAYAEVIDFRGREPRCITITGVALPPSAGPQAPRPAELEDGHVVTHGIRHLAQLATTPSQCGMDRVLSSHGIAWLRNFAAAPAGRIS